MYSLAFLVLTHSRAVCGFKRHSDWFGRNSRNRDRFYVWTNLTIAQLLACLSKKPCYFIMKYPKNLLLTQKRAMHTRFNLANRRLKKYEQLYFAALTKIWVDLLQLIFVISLWPTAPMAMRELCLQSPKRTTALPQTYYTKKQTKLFQPGACKRMIIVCLCLTEHQALLQNDPSALEWNRPTSRLGNLTWTI